MKHDTNISRRPASEVATMASERAGRNWANRVPVASVQRPEVAAVAPTVSLSVIHNICKCLCVCVGELSSIDSQGVFWVGVAVAIVSGGRRPRPRRRLRPSNQMEPASNRVAINHATGKYDSHSVRREGPQRCRWLCLAPTPTRPNDDDLGTIGL